MASERTTYWVAAGVLALFLGNHFVSKFDRGCLTQRSAVAAQRLSAEASHLLGLAQFALGRASSPWTGGEMTVARFQTQLGSAQTLMARQQAACARLEAERARMMALQQMQAMQFRVLCPRQRVRVAIPQPATIPDDGTI